MTSDGARALQIVFAVIPFIGFVGAVPFVNHVHPVVLGLPFLFFWSTLWVVLTPVCMAVVYYLDSERSAEERREP